MTSRTGEVKRHIRELRRRGYRIVVRGKHNRVYDGDVLVTTLPRSPSDTNWLKNSVREIVRYETRRNRRLSR